jgi:hypothetical protein
MHTTWGFSVVISASIGHVSSLSTSVHNRSYVICVSPVLLTSYLEWYRFAQWRDLRQLRSWKGLKLHLQAPGASDPRPRNYYALLSLVIDEKQSNLQLLLILFKCPIKTVPDRNNASLPGHVLLSPTRCTRVDWGNLAHGTNWRTLFLTSPEPQSPPPPPPPTHPHTHSN